MICPNCKAVDGWGAACYVCRPEHFWRYYGVQQMARSRREPEVWVPTSPEPVQAWAPGPRLPEPVTWPYVETQCVLDGCFEEATETGRCVRHEAVYQRLTEPR